MKKNLAPLLAVLCVSVAISVACATGGGVEPIVIDLSAPKTPGPTVTPSPAPTARPSPVSLAPIAEPAPAPAAARTEPVAIRSEAPSQAASAASSDGDPVRTVEARIDAFNRGDLAALAGVYAADARIYDPPDRVRDAGADGIRAALSRELAASPGGSIAVRDRVIQGAFVVERESRGGSSALVVYEVRSGRIANVWILR